MADQAFPERRLPIAPFERRRDCYEPERIAFARRLVATTDRVFIFVTAEGPLADVLRTRIAPLVLPKIVSFEFAYSQSKACWRLEVSADAGDTHNRHPMLV